MQSISRIYHKTSKKVNKLYRKLNLDVLLEAEKIGGIWSFNLVSELIRKALLVKCYQKGLQYCTETKLVYFPPDITKNSRINFIRPDGKKSNIVSNGRRTYRRGNAYLYFLAPDFFVRQDLFDDFTVVVRIRFRLSDTGGQPLKGHRTIVSRRKHLCKNWWNKHWFNRTLAVSQFLADGEKIIIGEQQDTQIIINAIPLHFNAPVSINEKGLGEISHE